MPLLARSALTVLVVVLVVARRMHHTHHNALAEISFNPFTTCIDVSSTVKARGVTEFCLGKK